MNTKLTVFASQRAAIDQVLNTCEASLTSISTVDHVEQMASVLAQLSYMTRRFMFDKRVFQVKLKTDTLVEELFTCKCAEIEFILLPRVNMHFIDDSTKDVIRKLNDVSDRAQEERKCYQYF